MKTKFPIPQREADNTAHAKLIARFRVRAPSGRASTFRQVEIPCGSMKEAEKEGERLAKSKKHSLVDVEERESNIWMLRRRWTRKQGWVVS